MPKNADVKSLMARKLRSKAGSAIYAQRKAIMEPVNGQIKEAGGLRRFLLRGLEKVDAEWHLIAATHNLLKLFRYRRSQQQAMALASGSGALALVAITTRAESLGTSEKRMPSNEVSQFG